MNCGLPVARAELPVERELTALAAQWEKTGDWARHRSERLLAQTDSWSCSSVTLPRRYAPASRCRCCKRCECVQEKGNGAVGSWKCSSVRCADRSKVPPFGVEGGSYECL